MSVLSTAAQQQVEETLVKDGILTKEKLAELKAAAEKESTPLLSFFGERRACDRRSNDQNNCTCNQSSVR